MTLTRTLCSTLYNKHPVLAAVSPPESPDHEILTFCQCVHLFLFFIPLPTQSGLSLEACWTLQMRNVAQLMELLHKVHEALLHDFDQDGINWVW